jgi:2-isopropylmalate synthase
MKRREGVEEAIRRISVFDTTLRDGEQTPGIALTPRGKLRMAEQLESLGVDVIEAGFPAASKSDFDSVRLVAEEIRSVQIAAIARARKDDIDQAWKALKKAARPRLTLFISTSDIHLRHQLRRSREAVLAEATEAVAYARSRTDNVEFSAMDATRSDRGYLRDVLGACIEAGARIVGIADTVGYAVPDEFGELVRYLIGCVQNSDRDLFSVHCHDDLGLAVANTLAGVRNGAGQVKCTVNGIGERAGNAALEEVVMALQTRQDAYKCSTRIDTAKLCASSRLLSAITGLSVPPNKAIVGANAFAHESGIHQDGMAKERTTYEIIEPKSVGAAGTHFVLGRLSGRRGLKERIKGIGINPDTVDCELLFVALKEWTMRKKFLSDDDLRRMISFST